MKKPRSCSRGFGSRRRGLTVLELLVALAVVGLLVTLTLPAVQAARESARRVQCTSHLHQIAIAAQNYEAVHRSFPGAPRMGWGEWKREILGCIEQPDEAEVVPIYACPSDTFGTGNLPKNQTCYEMNDGLWAADANGLARAKPQRRVKPRDVTDGLSTTAAFAERLAWPDWAPQVVPPTLFQDVWIRRIRNTAAFVSDLDAFADECRLHALPPGPGWMSVWGYHHVMTPNQNSCFNGPQSQPEATNFLAVTATSQHPGGVNVLFADGAVKFVTDGIDRNLWRAVGTRNGREVVGSF